jgi:hypothetical protein
MTYHVVSHLNQGRPAYGVDYSALHRSAVSLSLSRNRLVLWRLPISTQAVPRPQANPAIRTASGTHLLHYVIKAPAAMVLPAAPNRVNLGLIISDNLLHIHKRNNVSKQKPSLKSLK